MCRPGKYNLSTPVLVVSINSSGSEHIELPENGTVSMSFNLPEVCAVSSKLLVYCDILFQWSQTSKESTGW